MYIVCFWKTMIREWGGIDMLRMDKFLLLIRKFTNQTFSFLEQVRIFNRFVYNFRSNGNNHSLSSTSRWWTRQCTMRSPLDCFLSIASVSWMSCTNRIHTSPVTTLWLLCFFLCYSEFDSPLLPHFRDRCLSPCRLWYQGAHLFVHSWLLRNLPWKFVFRFYPHNQREKAKKNPLSRTLIFVMFNILWNSAEVT